MIIVKQSRVKDGKYFPAEDKSMTVFEALKFALKYEFGFGTTVTDMVEQSVTLTTDILGCVDTTIFEGTAAEMRWIKHAAAAYTLLRAQMYRPEFRDNLIGKVMHFTKGHPALVTTCSGFLLGETFTRGTVMALLLENDSTELTKLSNFGDAELMTMLEWKVVDELPLSEIIQLAA